MQSVFYPDERINIRYSVLQPFLLLRSASESLSAGLTLWFTRYDIKGCEVGRWTNPDTGGKQIIKVLKDNNFQGQSIALGSGLVSFRCRLCFSRAATKRRHGRCRWGEILVCQSGEAGQ